MTRARRPHTCPTCRCDFEGDDYGTRYIINRNAPFFPLVKMIDELDGQFSALGAGRGTRYATPPTNCTQANTSGCTHADRETVKA